MSGRFDNEEGVVSRPRTEKKLERPRLYRVLMHNDDYTTREFVVEVLMSVFHKTESEATQVMVHVHTTGVGLAGIYTREVAETKVHAVEQLANHFEYPLRLTMEPEEDD